MNKQGQIHGRICVWLCFLVNSGGAFVRMSINVRERVCVWACACVCVAIPRLCGSANSLISAMRVCVCVCVLAARWVEWLWNRRIEYWAFHSSARFFTRTAHSFAFSALLASLARSAALIRSFTRSPIHSLPSSSSGLCTSEHEKSAFFTEKKTRYGRMDLRTDGPTDGPMDGHLLLEMRGRI